MHDNEVRRCAGHALDLDAYTSGSAVWSNACEGNGYQGIFVEETAHDNFVFNNIEFNNLACNNLEFNIVFNNIGFNNLQQLCVQNH